MGGSGRLAMRCALTYLPEPQRRDQTPHSNPFPQSRSAPHPTQPGKGILTPGVAVGCRACAWRKRRSRRVRSTRRIVWRRLSCSRDSLSSRSSPSSSPSPCSSSPAPSSPTSKPRAKAFPLRFHASETIPPCLDFLLLFYIQLLLLPRFPSPFPHPAPSSAEISTSFSTSTPFSAQISISCTCQSPFLPRHPHPTSFPVQGPFPVQSGPGTCELVLDIAVRVSFCCCLCVC